MTVWRMRIACWIPTATNTHTQVVYYLLLQQCLHESASMLRYMYIACLVYDQECVRVSTAQYELSV